MLILAINYKEFWKVFFLISVPHEWRLDDLQTLLPDAV